MILARKMPEFYMIIARKIFPLITLSPIHRWTGYCFRSISLFVCRGSGDVINVAAVPQAFRDYVVGIASDWRRFAAYRHIFRSFYLSFFLCFFVNKITRKQLHRFAWNFQGRCGVTMGCATRRRGLLCFRTTACFTCDRSFNCVASAAADASWQRWVVESEVRLDVEDRWAPSHSQWVVRTVARSCDVVCTPPTPADRVVDNPIDQRTLQLTCCTSYRRLEAAVWLSQQHQLRNHLCPSKSGP